MGIITSLGLTRTVRGLIFDISPLDPLTFVSAPAALLAVALLASYLPARRATKIDPMEALRHE